MIAMLLADEADVAAASLSRHSTFLNQKQFPTISTVAYEQEWKMLQNEVQGCHNSV